MAHTFYFVPDNTTPTTAIEFQQQHPVDNSVTKQNPMNKSCPKRWREFYEACFFRVNQKVTFKEAVSACLQHEATLATVQNHKEYDFLKSKLRAFVEISLPSPKNCIHFPELMRTREDTIWLGYSFDMQRRLVSVDRTVSTDFCMG